jgi:flagellin-specific chaperone FliS
MRRLVEANLAQDPSMFDEVESLLAPLRDAWKTASTTAR